MTERATGVAVACALHVAAAAALLQLEAVRRPLMEAAPLMVDLLVPRLVEPPPPPAAAQPKPLSVARRAVPVPVPQPEHVPVVAVPVEAPTAPAAVVPTAPPAPVVEAVRAVPPRVIPPSFDAAYLRNPPPEYPSLSRRYGEQGRVVLRVHVRTDGGADVVELRGTSGHERLDRAALEAVRQWRFVPARQGETPVAAWVLVPITFSLEN